MRLMPLLLTAGFAVGLATAARAEYVKPDHAPASCLDFMGGTASLRRCAGDRDSQKITLPRETPSAFRVAGWCVEVDKAGQPLVTRKCREIPAQNWTYSARTGALRNVATGLCADVYKALKEPGTPVIAYTCTSAPNQRWSIADKIFVTGPKMLKPRYANNLCLDVANGESSLIIWSCHGKENQRFTLPDDANLSRIRQGEKCLAANSAGFLHFSEANCRGMLGNSFFIADGTGTIRARSGQCVSVPSASTKPGTQLRLEPCQQGAPNQIFVRQ